MHYILIDHENVQPADLAGMGAKQACVLVFTGAQQKVAISLIEAVQALGDRGRFVRISGNGRNALDFHIAYYLGCSVARDPKASFLIVSADAGYDPLIEHLKVQGIAARRIPLPTPAAPPKPSPVANPASKSASPQPAKKAAKTAAQQPAKAPAKKKGKKLTFIVDPPRPMTPLATRTPEPGPKTAPQSPKPAQANTQADAETVVRRLADMPKNLPGSEASLRRMVGTWLSKDAKRLDAVLVALKQSGIIVPSGTKLGYHLPKV